ncbi:MAG: glutaredoxin family protein [Cyanobium sp.]
MGEPAALVLYTRAGCCLCEGLEERLRALEPPPALTLVDVDQDPALQARYGLEVPVLALPAAPGEGEPRPLPRVSPRLAGARLHDWLRRHGGGGAPA